MRQRSLSGLVGPGAELAEHTRSDSRIYLVEEGRIRAIVDSLLGFFGGAGLCQEEDSDTTT